MQLFYGEVVYHLSVLLLMNVEVIFSLPYVKQMAITSYLLSVCYQNLLQEVQVVQGA